MTGAPFDGTGILATKLALLALLSLPLLPSPPQPSPPQPALYMPRDVKLAVAKGTRTLDGRPGPRYWQNHGRYEITLAVAPPDRRVAGEERITYVNESPDTLSSLVIRLFQNYHEPGAPRAGGTSPEFLTAGVQIDAFAVDGRPQPWRASRRSFTWQDARLPSPLLPHDSVRLSFRWHYDVSVQAGREGMIDSTTFFLAYFYPRVSVYDDVDGWDRMEHTGHEFYSDFNDYDVAVRVPPGFVVWGTGALQDPDSVLRPAYARRLRASFSSDTTIHVATAAELASGAVTRRGAPNVWRFASRDVPDVAFGVSDHYDWDAASVRVDDAARRRAGVQAAYHDTAADFHHMVQFGRHALDYLSHRWPGVPYPYAKTTEFQGGAGMEYPMMANDESYADSAMARFVANHEIAHTYMPFYMGIDETRYAFMDEGWATTFEYFMNVADRGRPAADDFFRRFRVRRWIADTSPAAELPIVTPADGLTGSAYGYNAYGKAALGYIALRDMLGDSTFAAALHAYMSRWHGKHPTPWDFFYTFDAAAGRDLDWFWSAWYFAAGTIDLAVADVRRDGDGYTVAIDNVGGLPAPFDLRLRYDDGRERTVHESAAVWRQDTRRAEIRLTGAGALAGLVVDGGIWMDADTVDNRWSR